MLDKKKHVSLVKFKIDKIEQVVYPHLSPWD